MFTREDLSSFKTRKDIVEVAKAKKINIAKPLEVVQYEAELKILQEQLVNLQQHIQTNGLRVAILFEGRDAAGKGGSIKRFMEHLNPRLARVVALSKPTAVERGQWYFRRYIKEMPNPGEIVFFDRSWYNRAVVEPVMGFCSEQQYSQFMVQVPEFEHMLAEDGIKVIKFWFSISKSEQNERFEARLNNPLKVWKFSPVDRKGQELWESYTHYKQLMFARTHTTFCPWIIVKGNTKRQARLESMRYVISQFRFDDKQAANPMLLPDPNIVMRYHREIDQLDI
ncbi:MAG: polyphosphate kinase 2 [Flavobacteriales bacterium]|nr:polyphosphate kinase 2 [Flavobacteriales bacterium]MBT4931441.1 polyphosphate kinase 2 [Flavobacteriales bacterium]